MLLCFITLLLQPWDQRSKPRKVEQGSMVITVDVEKYENKETTAMVLGVDIKTYCVKDNNRCFQCIRSLFPSMFLPSL